MANPQKENGFTAISNELLEKIIQLKIPPSEKDMLLFVIRKTYGFAKKEDIISLTQFEKGTSISRPTVVKGLKNLLSMKILYKNLNKFMVNKDYDEWVVNPALLVKNNSATSKHRLTEIGKPRLTHKRKKKYTKENTANQDLHENIVSVIETFSKINPACIRMYGNKTQRQACEDLIESFGLDRVLTVIEKTIPKTNTMQFFPTITTPLQLRDKWIALESAIKRYQSEVNKNKVAF
jgi:phage replication O-like protein O